MSRKVSVIGVGNWLMGDEGVGVHTARHLETMEWPAGVTILDGGTGGFHLMEYLEQADHVILVDATLDGRRPGTIRLLHPRFASDFPKALSSHDIGLRDLLEGLAILGRMPDVCLYAVSIETVQPQTIELSPAVAGVLPGLIQEVRRMVLQLMVDGKRPAGTAFVPPTEGRPFERYQTRLESGGAAS